MLHICSALSLKKSEQAQSHFQFGLLISRSRVLRSLIAEATKKRVKLRVKYPQCPGPFVLKVIVSGMVIVVTDVV